MQNIIRLVVRASKDDNQIIDIIEFNGSVFRKDGQFIAPFRNHLKRLMEMPGSMTLTIERFNRK